jgi:proteasome alpha subunit
LQPGDLEVAILDHGRPRRAFRRLTGTALVDLLPERPSTETDGVESPTGSGDSSGTDS